MIVTGCDGRRLISRRDRYDQFVLESLLALGCRHDAAASSEKRIVGHHGLYRKADGMQHLFAALEPVVAVLECLLRRPEPNVFALPEDLHPRRIGRGLVAEDERAEINDPALFAQRARCRRVQGIAGGRNHHPRLAAIERSIRQPFSVSSA
jgi:hypothetical protein